MRWRDVPAYVTAQVAGGIVGVVLANLMFSLPAVTLATRQRGGGGVWLAEAVATFGLLLVFGMSRSRRTETAPFAVGAYITGAYFFTSSTSFANPAVSLARMLSNTFAGIEPGSVVMFVTFQVVGGAVAAGVVRLLYPRLADGADDVVVPHVVEVGL